ncbi:MAG: GntR family transcriptional regulator, partial [Hyphomicrobiales bacterium]
EIIDFPAAKGASGTLVSKAQRAYGFLREGIVSLEVPPGTPINKEDLCARLRISRHPVAEALARLADDGLVEIEPQKGTYVARIHLSAVNEGAFLRRAIEVACVREITPTADAALMEELQRNMRYQNAAIEAGDNNGFYALDLAFHHALLGRLGFTRTIAAVDASRAQLERVRRLTLPKPGRIAATGDEHMTIVEAIAARDADAAAEAMRTHLAATMAEVEDFARSQPEYFAG